MLATASEPRAHGPAARGDTRAAEHGPGRRPAPGPAWQAVAWNLVPAIVERAVPGVQRDCGGADDGDACEREARVTAERVVSAPVPVLQREPRPVLRRCACGGTCPLCRAGIPHGDDAPAQGSAPPAGLPAEVGTVVRSPGAPLEPATRAYMEMRFGRDFGGVRVHTGTQADASARAVDARAYTLGDHVAFAAGEYAPGTADGRQLLAHELTHVVQQRQGPVAVQRQGHGVGRTGRGSGGSGGGCALELCFVPIHRGGLGAVGAVHGVINVRDSHGSAHFEVDPAQHRAEAPMPGLHSHVVRAGGSRSAGTCQTIPATCAQVSAVRASAQRYEELDVVYNPPPGPNSNSFPEWVLTDAGLPTSGIATPAGALGWGYYLSNPALRANPPRVTRRADEMHCTGVTPARSFTAMVDLVRAAEVALTACGVTSVEERIHILRGIYYGTIWSMDYSHERSPVRNAFFQRYTDTSTPRDPRVGCMPCQMYLSLARSQDLVDPSGRRVDFGHLLIGLDARHTGSSARTSTLSLEGVTGLEASTWAGDLGGGAARLALDRANGLTARRADHYFRGTDYGGPINLEGDVAAYATAAGAVTAGVAPSLTLGTGATPIADALQAYLLPPRGATTGWNSRCSVFLQAMGGVLSGTTLTNRPVVEAYLAERIHNFACSYLANYMRQRSVGTPATCNAAALHLEGAAQEMAHVFADALEYCVSHPGRTLQARGTAPRPTPAATSPSMRCRITCAGLGVLGPLGGAAQGAERRAEELLHQGEDLLRRGGEELDRLRRSLPRIPSPF